MNDITPFDFEGERVRTVVRAGEPWFLAIDVCRVLDIGNPSMAASRLDDDEKDGLSIVDSIGRSQKTVIINESGLYSLILTSRKPEAKRFDRWVLHEVLPAIRRDGGYMMAAPEEPPEELMARALKVAQATVDRQTQRLAVAEPKVEALDRIAGATGSLCITDTALAN